MSDIINYLKQFLINNERKLNALNFDDLYFGWIQSASNYSPTTAVPLLSKALMSVGLKPWTSLKYIEIYSFYKLKGLGDVVLSPNVYQILNSAFAYSDIRTIKIPESIGYIEINAFEGSDLKTIYYMGSRNDFIKILQYSGWPERLITDTLKYCIFNK